MELIAESYTIAEKSGVGQDLVYECIKGNFRRETPPSQKLMYPPHTELFPAPLSVNNNNKSGSNSSSFAVGSPTVKRCCTMSSTAPSAFPSTAA